MTVTLRTLFDLIQKNHAEIKKQLNRIEKREKRQTMKIDDVITDLQDQSTVEDGLVTLTTNLKTSLDAALKNQGIPPDVQAKIDAAFAQIEANKKKIADAIVANTPVAPATP
jgi:hypothetical protein